VTKEGRQGNVTTHVVDVSSWQEGYGQSAFRVGRSGVVVLTGLDGRVAEGLSHLSWVVSGYELAGGGVYSPGAPSFHWL
jgi:hypothetical protein